MRGRNVMMGYLGEEAKTGQVIDSDGWLRSGDIGTVDEKGFYKVTGRSKEIIVTAGGENIPPIPIEDDIKVSEVTHIIPTTPMNPNRNRSRIIVTHTFAIIALSLECT